MSGAPSKWTCTKCNEVVATTHKGAHRKYRCPEQGNLLRAKQRQRQAISNVASIEAESQKALEEAKPPPPKFWQYLPCLCQCGTDIGQVKGQKKRQFVDASHYEKWRREALKKAAGGEAELVEERKHAQEVAALVAKDEAIAREVDALPLLSREASYVLWGVCLGVAL